MLRALELCFFCSVPGFQALSFELEGIKKHEGLKLLSVSLLFK